LKPMPKVVFGGLALVIVAGGVLCFSGLYGSPFERIFLAIGKLVGLAVAASAAFVAYGRHGTDDRQRFSWLLLAIGLLLYTMGQEVLAYHQIILGIETPFPSAGDPLFVAAALLILAAFLDFCLIASRSGVPLGGPLAFWGPALAVLGVFGVGAYWLLGSVIRSGDPAVEVFLNVFYPTASAVTLAPCLVALRMGFLFRGGRLLLVWLPLTLGFMAVAISDVLYACLTSLDIAALQAAVDFLYYAGYLTIAAANLAQVDLLKV
jgi:hypothetical protein